MRQEAAPLTGSPLQDRGPCFLREDGCGLPPANISTELWWNFVGRSHEEIEQACRDWMEGTRFGEVHGYADDRLPAPELPPVALKTYACGRGSRVVSSSRLPSRRRRLRDGKSRTR
ncbi:hypothetical protein J7I98_32530 [Streptomyces sp. ISL-98]|nr:hypothetical protein [Streptomyces sp. ISL-98]